MSSSMIQIAGATVAPVVANSSFPVYAASEARHVGFFAPLFCSGDGRSLRQAQNAASLSSGRWLSSSRPALLVGACSSPGSQLRHRRAVVCMVLPTGNPVKEGHGTGAQGHSAWSARAIKSFSMSELEARKLKYPTTGTESLLMGILTEGTSRAAKFLRSKGVTLFGVREQTIQILGKADMYFFSPEHPPLTEQAQKALDWAVEENNRRGGAEITTSLMLLGIWNQKGSAGEKVLEALGFDDEKAEELLASDKVPVAVS